MFGLFFPIVLAASMAVPTPQPTLPPEIGTIYVRGHCNEGRRSLSTVLPILIRNDNTIGAAVKGLGRVDSTEDAATRLTITRTRTMSSQIFKNLEAAKAEAMRLHVLAAASVNPIESKQFSDVADSLDSIISQQNSVADQLNGYADTADMGLLYQGSETERAMNAANLPADNTSSNAQAARQTKHGSLADTNIGALTTNVYRDVQGMRQNLAQTENTTTLQVKQIVQSCSTAKRKP